MNATANLDMSEGLSKWLKHNNISGNYDVLGYSDHGKETSNNGGYYYFFRDMYVDFGEVLSKLSSLSEWMYEVRIFADVVNFPQNFILPKELKIRSVTIVARQIMAQSGGEIQLSGPDEYNLELNIFCTSQGLKGNIKISVYDEKHSKIAVARIAAEDFGPKDILVSYPWSTDNHTVDTTEMDLDYSVEGDPWLVSLGMPYQFAVIFFNSHPDLAKELLLWVIRCTRSQKKELYVQSSSLLAMLLTEKGNSKFVPYLSAEMYEVLSEAYIAEVSAYHDQYNKYKDERLDSKKRIENANLLLKNKGEVSTFNKEMLKQAKTNYESARKTATSTLNSLNAQQAKVDDAKSGFEKGLKEFQNREKIHEVLEIITGVFEFGGAIAGLMVGDPAGTGKLAKAISEIGEKAEALANIMESIQKISEIIERVKKMTEEIEDAVEAFGKDSGKPVNFDALSSKEITNASTIEQMAKWNEFTVEVSTKLAPVIKAGVGNASNYEIQLKNLAIEGRAYAEAQLVLTKTGQKLFQAQLQQQVNSKQEDIIKKFIDGIGEEFKKDARIEQMFYQRYLEVKRPLFLSLENYVLAYKYWALQESSVKPAISSTIPDLINQIAQIKEDTNRALRNFNPYPQKMEAITISIKAKDFIKNLKGKKTASWPITLECPEFNDFQRIRAEKVRIELIGGEKVSTGKILIDFGTTGHYQDRYKGKNFQFVSSPLKEAIMYTWKGDGKDRAMVINIPGEVFKEEEGKYFMPSVFTTWTFTIKSPSDLSDLSEVQLTFNGTLIVSDQ